MFKRYFFIKSNTICFSKHQIYFNIGEKDETDMAPVPRGNMKELRGDFHKILTEAQHVARACGMTPELLQVRQKRRSKDDLNPEKEFRGNVFYIHS